MSGIETTIANTFGALEIGTFVAICLFGIITLQTEHYFREFREDKWLLKVTVLATWFLELGHTIGICFEVYRATILFTGSPLEYNSPKGFGTSTLLGGVITMLVQGFFSLRAWYLLPSPYRYIGLSCVIVSVARCGFSTYLAYRALIATSVARYTLNVSWLVTMLLSVGVGLDVVVALTMLYFFLEKRKRALSHTTRLIDKLLGYTIRTGMLTSSGAITVLIVFQLAPDTYIWAAFYCSLAKLYSNSFLSVLNGRQGLRRTIGASGVIVNNSDSNLKRPNHRVPLVSVVVGINTNKDLELQEHSGTWQSAVTPSPGGSSMAIAPFAN